MSFIDGAPLKRSRNLIVAPSADAGGDPLWDSVWLLLPLDSLAQGDVSNNGFIFDRVIPPDYVSDDPLADVLASAAKWGAAGWSCHRNFDTGTGNIYEVDPTAWFFVPAATKTWGTKFWTVEFWVQIGDNVEPVGQTQRRFDLYGTLTASTQTLQVGTREGFLRLSIRRSTTGTMNLGAVTTGFRTGAAGNFECWNADPASGSPVFTDNNYHWIVVTYDGSFLRMLFDGAVVFQCAASINFDDAWADMAVGGQALDTGGLPFSLASGPLVGDSATDGIDDVRVTLSATENRYTSFPVAVPTAAFPTSA